MPSTTEFDKQSVSYKKFVLPDVVTARVALEASVVSGWYKYIGIKGEVVGMKCFGESAPASELFSELGITVGAILESINNVKP